MRTLLGLLLLVPATAAAQGDAPPGSLPKLPAVETSSVVTTSSVATAPTPPLGPGQVEEAWERYHDAFLAIANGDRARGRRLLREVIDRFGAHPATDLAAEILASLSTPLPPPQKATHRAQFGPEGPSALARAELATFQTLYGITAGGLFCGALSCNDERLLVGSLAIGGATGLAVSLLGTRGGITPGRAQTIDAASGWGLFNGFALAGAADLDTAPTFGLMLASQIAGVGAALAINRYRDPRGGDVSRATSFGLWAGVLTLFVHGATDFDASGRAVNTSLLVVVDAALVTAGVLNYLDIAPVSRGRMLLIDAGGVVGALVGMGVPIFIANSTGSPEVFFTSAILGTISGLGLTTYLTRDWDDFDVPDVSIGVLPSTEGEGASIVLGGRF